MQRRPNRQKPSPRGVPSQNAEAALPSAWRLAGMPLRPPRRLQRLDPCLRDNLEQDGLQAVSPARHRGRNGPAPPSLNLLTGCSNARMSHLWPEAEGGRRRLGARCRKRAGSLKLPKAEEPVQPRKGRAFLAFGCNETTAFVPHRGPSGIAARENRSQLAAAEVRPAPPSDRGGRKGMLPTAPKKKPKKTASVCWRGARAPKSGSGKKSAARNFVAAARIRFRPKRRFTAGRNFSAEAEGPWFEGLPAAGV